MGRLQHTAVCQYQLNRLPAVLLLNLGKIIDRLLVWTVCDGIPRSLFPALDPMKAKGAVAIP